MDSPDWKDATDKWAPKKLNESRHKAGCQCGFCKNMGSFGKKKKEVDEGEDEDNQKDNPEFKEKDEKQFRKDRSASPEGEEVRKHLDKDKKKNVKEGVYIPHVKEPDFAYCVGCGEKMPSDHPSSSNQHKVCDKCKGYKPGEKKDDKLAEQQRIDESYTAPFQRMRSLAGVGNMILTSNGLMENKNDPGANKPFNTNWKMDKEKAGFVKIDEDKLKKVKATLEKKSKRGTLSDKELQLAKRLDEVLKRRQAKA
jgi:RNA polymerase-binding transcription factor DksA